MADEKQDWRSNKLPTESEFVRRFNQLAEDYGLNVAKETTFWIIRNKVLDEAKADLLVMLKTVKADGGKFDLDYTSLFTDASEFLKSGKGYYDFGSSHYAFQVFVKWFEKWFGKS